MQKNTKRTKKLDVDDERGESLDHVIPKKPLEVIAIACDTKNNVLGLGNNGKVYRYNYDNREWVMVWDVCHVTVS